jgi:hypothetical protein
MLSRTSALHILKPATMSQAVPTADSVAAALLLLPQVLLPMLLGVS